MIFVKLYVRDTISNEKSIILSLLKIIWQLLKIINSVKHYISL